MHGSNISADADFDKNYFENEMLYKLAAWLGTDCKHNYFWSST